MPPGPQKVQLKRLTVGLVSHPGAILEAMRAGMDDATSSRRSPVRADVAVTRAQRYACELTAGQVETFEVWRSGARWLWNQATRSQTDRYRSRQGVESRMSLGYGVKAARDAGWTVPHHGEQRPLCEVPSKVLHGALVELSAGWSRHLRARKAKVRSAPPGFRSAHRGGSIRWQTQQGSGPAPRDAVVTETRPGRAVVATISGLGPVKVRYHRPLPPDALVGNLILGVDELGKHWLVVQYETSQVRQPAPTGLVGVDRGVTVTLATSTGQTYQAPTLTVGQDRRKVRLERGLARKRRLNPCRHDQWTTGRNGRPRIIRGHCPPDSGCACWKHSRRYQADKRAVAKLAQHGQRQRTDGAHKASRALADQAATVVLERLDVSAMTATAKGTLEAPGRNVKAKAGLNRGILAANWYQIATYTAYKTSVATVPAPDTSTTCPNCGHIHPDNRPTRDLFRCVACGHDGHADIVAAVNIEARHRAETAAAQAEEAQETSEPARAEPANDHHPPERSSRHTATLDRTPPAQKARTTRRPTGPLVPNHWGIATARKRPRTTRPCHPMPASSRNGQRPR